MKFRVVFSRGKIGVRGAWFWNMKIGQFVRLVEFVKLIWPNAVTTKLATTGLCDKDNVIFGPRTGWASLNANAVKFPN